MAKQRGLGYVAALAGGAVLAGPYVQPPWLMALVIILFSLILWRFFDTKYLPTYSVSFPPFTQSISSPLWSLRQHSR